jgi:hypothetical protein
MRIAASTTRVSASLFLLSIVSSSGCRGTVSTLESVERLVWVSPRLFRSGWVSEETLGDLEERESGRDGGRASAPPADAGRMSVKEGMDLVSMDRDRWCARGRCKSAAFPAAAAAETPWPPFLFAFFCFWVASSQMSSLRLGEAGFGGAVVATNGDGRNCASLALEGSVARSAGETGGNKVAPLGRCRRSDDSGRACAINSGNPPSTSSGSEDGGVGITPCTPGEIVP